MKSETVSIRLMMSFAITAFYLHSNVAFADVQIGLDSSKSKASGIIKKVDYVKVDLRGTGAKRPVVVVTINQYTLPSGDVASDAIYFSDGDVGLGLGLAGAIGKKIQMDTSGTFTISE